MGGGVMEGFGLGFLLGVLIGFLAGMLIGVLIMAEEREKIKQQSFERGHMVQCVGKTGYYWECE